MIFLDNTIPHLYGALVLCLSEWVFQLRGGNTTPSFAGRWCNAWAVAVSWQHYPKFYGALVQCLV